MNRIGEFRIALTVEQFEDAVRFYRDALGLETRLEWRDDQGQGVILELPRATLELLDRPQAHAVDLIEAGKLSAGEVRFAVQVDELRSASRTLEAAGAKPVHQPVHTPWRDLNQRLETPDGRQITLFQPEEPA